MLLRLLRLGYALSLSALMYGTFSTPAYAYLDPGTGSMILQVLLGGVAGVAVAGRFYWHKLRTMIGLEPASAKAEPTYDEARGDPRAE